MSTLDSLINSCSTILTIDFYKRFLRKDATDKAMIRFGQVTSTLLFVIGVLWAPVVASWRSIFAYFQECWFFMAVPIVVVFGSALLWKRANSVAAMSTLLLSLPLLFLPFLLRSLNIEMNSFNVAGLLLIPVTGFHVLIAYLGQPPPAEVIQRWTWKPSMLKLPAAELPLRYRAYKRLFLWWLVLVVIFTFLYVVLW
jgi:SSS family solute:Na+ symporter